MHMNINHYSILLLCTCFATKSGDAEVNHPGIRSRPRGLKEAVKVGSKPPGGGQGGPKNQRVLWLWFTFGLNTSLHNM